MVYNLQTTHFLLEHLTWNLPTSSTWGTAALAASSARLEPGQAESGSHNPHFGFLMISFSLEEKGCSHIWPSNSSWGVSVNGFPVYRFLIRQNDRLSQEESRYQVELSDGSEAGKIKADWTWPAQIREKNWVSCQELGRWGKHPYGEHSNREALKPQNLEELGLRMPGALGMEDLAQPNTGSFTGKTMMHQDTPSNCHIVL